MKNIIVVTMQRLEKHESSFYCYDIVEVIVDLVRA